MRLSTALKSLISLGAVLTLTACFVSREPLIGREDSSNAFRAGHYAYYEADPDYPDKPAELRWTGEVTISQGVYSSPDNSEDFPYQASRFTTLRRNTIWIAQHPPQPQDEGYFYTLLYRDRDNRNRFYMEWVVCGVLTEDQRDNIGIVLEDDDVCEFTDLETLKHAMSIWDSGRRNDTLEGVPPFPAGRSYIERVD